MKNTVANIRIPHGPPPAVSGLHPASLPHGGFVCSDYLHLTARRHSLICIFPPWSIYTTHKQQLHVFNLPPSLMCHPHLLSLQVRRPPRLSGLFTSITSKADVYKMQSACVRASVRDLDSSRAPSTIQRCRRRPGELLEGRRHACGHRGPRLRCSHQRRNARERSFIVTPGWCLQSRGVWRGN